MKITIQYQPTEYILGYDWTFECQHASTHTEEVDCGYADSYIGDWVEDWQNVEICDECNTEVEEF